MSYDDNQHGSGQNGSGQGGRDRGAYTPPTDDDLPFNRGGFDARRTPPAKAPPVTLIISAVVLLVLIVAVVLFYRSGLRASSDVPPAVGTPVGEMKVQAPVDAQPVDEEAGVDVYGANGVPVDTAPTYTAPPEAVQPRPAPRPLPPVTSDVLTPAQPAAKPTTAPTPPVVRPSMQATATPATTPAATTGSAAVQIGAFSSTAIADREFAAVAARFPQFARGASKRVQQVTASNGSTVYRTTFYGLSRERAQAFCSAIQAAGDDCLVR